MQLLKVDTLDEARQKLLSVRKKPPETEIVPAAASLGRILAQNLYAPEELPAFPRSLVDGYAVKAADTGGAGESIPVFLRLVDKVRMGCPALREIKSGECAYVPTGAMLPTGADAMVMVEYSEAFGSDRIALYQSVAPGADLVLPGEDMKKGTLILQAGKKLLPADLGLMAAAGIQNLQVYKPLSLALISTGDELVNPETEPALGQIRDVNTYSLSALARLSGYSLGLSAVLPDDEAAIEARLKAALGKVDVVVLSGGSSKGERDYTVSVIENVTKPGILSHGIAFKPGKPTILGWDEATETLIVGLPGHPVSAVMIFKLLLSWLYRNLTGQREPFSIPARITTNLAGSPGKTTSIPVRLHWDGGYRAEAIFGKSALISRLSQADGFITIDYNKEGLKKDEEVMVELW
jgi:molybdopterin molybdotransferase